MFYLYLMQISFPMTERKPVTVYHVHFKDKVNDSIIQQDYYFGSISAIFSVFETDQIGIKPSSLYNLNLDEHENPVYENKKCVIRKSSLITKTKLKK